MNDEIKVAHFRQMEINIDDQQIVIGLMAHPLHPKQTLSLSAIMAILHTCGFQTLIAFEKEAHEQIKIAWESFPNSDWHLIDVPDFTAPSIDQLNEFYKLIKNSAEQKKAIIVHCKAGFGRSGTMVASLILRALIHKKIKQPFMHTTPLEHTTLIKDADQQAVLTTALVAKAIEKIRIAGDKKYSSGHSVEMESQIRILEELEEILHLSFNT